MGQYPIQYDESAHRDAQDWDGYSDEHVAQETGAMPAPVQADAPEAAQADTIAELQAENERLQAEVNNWREQVRRQVEAREAIATDKQKTIEAMQQHTDVIRIDLVQARANEAHLQRKVASYVGIMEVLLDLINEGYALDILRLYIEIQQRYGVYGEAD